VPTPLGDKIRRLRKDKRYSLDRLAELADISKSYLWELENRETANPTMDKVAKIAAVLEVTPEFLLDNAQTESSDEVADRAFFRKYQKLSPPTKQKIHDILKVLQEDDRKEETTPIPPKGPIAEANRLSMLLNLSLGNDRFPVNVETLAKDYAGQFGHDDPIAHVVGDNLPGFEGALYATKSAGRQEWALVYNSAIEIPGRIRFTLAHELGHYILHRQMRKTFECSENDMLRWESEERRIEAEADVFASSLLMPIDDFRRQIGREVVDLELLDDCARRYGVSLTAAVLKWLEFTPQRALLVVSRDGHILWARSSQSALKSGAFFRVRNRVVPLPTGSLAACENIVAPERQGIELPAQTWFPQEPKDMSLREMKIVSDRYEQTMSLLILPKAEPRHLRPEDDDDDGGALDDYIQSGHLPKR
jgi:transcriptional regulator with XRE-family HTH domain